RHLDENENVIPTEQGTSDEESHKKLPINTVVYNATAEVSGAIVTAVMTTIISFIPVFTMIGAEGKLFRPLAFTKTFALTASIIIALFLIPPFAAFLFKNRKIRRNTNYGINGLLLVAGFIVAIFGHWLGLILMGFSFLAFAKLRGNWSKERSSKYSIYLSAVAIVFLLAGHWRPFGVDKSVFWNLIFVAIICFGLLASFSIFKNYYSRILKWARSEER